VVKAKKKPSRSFMVLRLYPSRGSEQVREGEAVLRERCEQPVPLHLIEGTREQIRAQ